MRIVLNLLAILGVVSMIILPMQSRAQQVKSAGAGCSKDTDCKGSRVCESKTCVAPSSSNSSKSAASASPAVSSECQQFYIGRAIDFGTFKGFVTGIGGDRLSMRVTDSRAPQDIGRVQEFGCAFTAQETR